MHQFGIVICNANKVVGAFRFCEVILLKMSEPNYGIEMCFCFYYLSRLLHTVMNRCLSLSYRGTDINHVLQVAVWYGRPKDYIYSNACNYASEGVMLPEVEVLTLTVKTVR